MIPFNKPYLHGRELVYIAQAVASGKISGDGLFTKKCHQFFEKKYGFSKVLLTTSCTDALEMAAILLNIQKGDEVILPAYTFVSSANAFALRGAKLIFADSSIDSPNIDPEKIEELITERTKAIVVVHYAGVACDMDAIEKLANKYNIPIVEDAAQAIDSFYKGKPLGSIGDIGAFSFHETKNIISGEGGMIVVNDHKHHERAEIIREKGTNRSAFFRGEVDKYGWVDIGSSFLPSDIIAAYLYAQIECLDTIQAKRKLLWSKYHERLRGALPQYGVSLPDIPSWATNNGHMFYLVCKDLKQRTGLIEYLKHKEVLAVFHYISLHTSSFYQANNDGRLLPNSDRYTDCLIRLPLYFEMTDDNIDYIADEIIKYFREVDGK